MCAQSSLSRSLLSPSLMHLLITTGFVHTTPRYFFFASFAVSSVTTTATGAVECTPPGLWVLPTRLFLLFMLFLVRSVDSAIAAFMIGGITAMKYFYGDRKELPPGIPSLYTTPVRWALTTSLGSAVKAGVASLWLFRVPTCCYGFCCCWGICMPQVDAGMVDGIRVRLCFACTAHTAHRSMLTL